MPSDDAVPSDAVPTDDGFLRRAELLAELGQYDEAVAELGQALTLDRENAAALSLLASVQLAANRPAEALDAVDRALAVEPGSLALLVRRALALIDLRRFGEAARLADAMLSAAPDSPYAQRSGAAILGEARNGQAALNAAWRAVALAPEEPEGHLVLGVVAAPAPAGTTSPSALTARRCGSTRTSPTPDRPWASRRSSAAGMPAPLNSSPRWRRSCARRSAPDPARRVGSDAVRQLIIYGGAYTIVAAVIVACLGASNGLAGRALGAIVAVVGGLLVWSYARRLPPAGCAS